MGDLMEKDVQDMEVEVGPVDWSDPAVRGWILNSIRECTQLAKQYQAAWLLGKLMRDDSQMQVTSRELERCRKRLQLLREEFLPKVEGLVEPVALGEDLKILPVEGGGPND